MRPNGSSAKRQPWRRSRVDRSALAAQRTREIRSNRQDRAGNRPPPDAAATASVLSDRVSKNLPANLHIAKGPQMFKPSTIATVKATAPVLAVHGYAIIQRFYQRLFEAHPELKNMFNMRHQERGEQQRALAGGGAGLCHPYRQPVGAGPAVERITHKHASLNVQPEQYAVVGRAPAGGDQGGARRRGHRRHRRRLGRGVPGTGRHHDRRPRPHFTKRRQHARAAGAAGATSWSGTSDSKARSSPPSSSSPKTASRSPTSSPASTSASWSTCRAWACSRCASTACRTRRTAGTTASRSSARAKGHRAPLATSRTCCTTMSTRATWSGSRRRSAPSTSTWTPRRRWC